MGTRHFTAIYSISKQDHPHAYGDKLYSAFSLHLYIGSSPRVWGQVIRLFENPAELRIIPTRMGTSYLTCIIYDGLEDHPHAYGDKFYIVYFVIWYLGSSPRVWGQDNYGCTVFCQNRIIPTRMGTRSRLCWAYAGN